MPGFDAHSERELESLLTVGNGLIGVRGSLEEGIEESQPATLLAGIFNRLPKTYDPPERLGECPTLVVAPDWLRLSVTINGESLSIKNGEAYEHERILDLCQAAMIRRWRHRLPSGQMVRLVTLRAALFPDRHILIQRVWIQPEDF